jgi:hypothetical protein
MPEEIVSRILRLPGYRVYASEAEDASSILRLWVRPTAAEPAYVCGGCGQAGRDVHVGLNGGRGICRGAPGRCGSCWKCPASSVPDGPARAHSGAGRPMSSSRSRWALRSDVPGDGIDESAGRGQGGACLLVRNDDEAVVTFRPVLESVTKRQEEVGRKQARPDELLIECRQRAGVL